MSFSSNKTAPNNISLDGSQTIQNKTLDSTNDYSGDVINPSRLDVKQDTLSNLETYAGSASNGQIVYATDVKKMYQIIDNALTEVGGGSSEVNYITNSDFETGISDWTGDSNLTLVQETTNPLRGTSSLKIEKRTTATNQQVYTDFSVETADLAKKLTISFDYDFSAANYSDGYFIVKVIKDPSGTPVTIRVNGEDVKGGKGTHIAQFQTDATETDYRLVLEYTDSLGAAADLFIDNVKVGPREVAKGAAMTDWEDFTPTGSWTSNTTYEGKWRRVGSDMEMHVKIATSNTPTAAALTVNIPNGHTVSTDIFEDSGISDNTSGNMVAYEGGVGKYAGTVRASRGSSSVQLRLFSDTGSYENLVNITNSVPFAWGAGDYIIFNTKFPIQGWSSNAVMSEDLGGRDIVVRREKSTTTNWANNSEANISFDTTPVDTAGIANSSSTITVDETGYYDLSGYVKFAQNTTGYRRCSLFVNGSHVARSTIAPASNNSTDVSAAADAVYIEKGQTIQLRARQYSGGGSLDLTEARLFVRKTASPQTILETETVAARYKTNSGQSLSNSVEETVLYNTKDHDTHNAYNTTTGIYTVPVSGYYMINTKAATNETPGAGDYLQMLLKVNDVTVSRHRVEFAAAGTTSAFFHPKIDESIYLEKGDEVKVIAVRNANSSLTTNGDDNKVSIIRIK
jgi:hypothetical protein